MARLTEAGGYRRGITSRVDVEATCRVARKYAQTCGFSDLKAAELQLVCSELGNNLLVHARDGELNLAVAADGERPGVRIVAIDAGPGIQDVELAMSEGYSTSGGLGHGLPLVRRLADTFEIASTSQGTRIVVTKWA